MVTINEIAALVSKPFSAWPAARSGIIDKQGNLTKPLSSLTYSERKQWTELEQAAAAVKTNQGPGALGTIAAIAAAVYLLRGGKRIEPKSPEFLALKRRGIVLQ